MKRNFDKIIEALERDGDPEDQFLNYIEEKLILPRMEDNRLQNVVCRQEKQDFDDCTKNYVGPLKAMCVVTKFHNFVCVLRNKGKDDIADDCSEEYLALRSKYRETKDPKILLRMKAAVFPSLFKSDSS